MKNTISQLFIDLYGNDSARILRAIQNTNTRFLTEELQLSLDREFYSISQKARVLQRLKNSCYLKDIKKMLSFAEKENLRLVFLKGIFLAADLYQKMDSRQSNDIDCLVEEKNFLKLHDFILQLGYESESISQDDITNGIYREKIDNEHSCYKKMIGNIALSIEVHCYAINAGKTFAESADFFIEQSEPGDLLELKPYLLKTEYNLVFLMMHFFKHLPVYYLHNSILGHPVKINLSNLCDIALMVKKYGQAIDWETVRELSKKLMVVSYVEAVALLVNKIFGPVFDGRFLNMLEECSDYSRLNKIKYERYGMGKFMWLFDEMVISLKQLSPCDIFEGKLSRIPDLRRVAVGNTNDLVRIGDGVVFTKEFPLGFGNAEEGAAAHLVAKIHDKGMDVCLKVDHKRCCVYTGEGNLFDKDGIEILVVKKCCIIHKMYTISGEEEKYGLIVTSQNDEQETKRNADNEFVKYEISDHLDGFTFRLWISFQALSILPQEEDEFIFNVGGLISNPFTEKFTGNYKLFDNQGDFFHFRNLPGVRLG